MKKAKSQMVMSSPMESPKDGSEQDHEANSAYRTIVDADGHRADPEMMKRVAKVAERHMATGRKVMKSVQDIKDYRKEKYPAVKKYEAKPDGDE